MQEADSPAQRLLELRQAVRDLQEHGLLNSAKWAAEHAVAVQPVRAATARLQRLAHALTRGVAGSWWAPRARSPRRRRCRMTTCTRSPRRSST
jgi:hypothetical protein